MAINREAACASPASALDVADDSVSSFKVEWSSSEMVIVNSPAQISAVNGRKLMIPSVVAFALKHGRSDWSAAVSLFPRDDGLFTVRGDRHWVVLPGRIAAQLGARSTASSLRLTLARLRTAALGFIENSAPSAKRSPCHVLCH